MPFERPTLADLVSRIREDIKARLSSSGPLLRRSVADILGPVWAGATHMLHGHLEWLSRQLFADTAEEPYLLRMAAMHGIFPTPATYASGTTEATGSNGTVIPEDTILVYADGQQFIVTAEATIASGVATLSITAVTAGAAGNLEGGEILSLESPIAGCDTDTTIIGDGLTGGADQGSLEHTRTRFIQRLQEPPMGGRASDYEAWALAVSGVTRVWVYPLEDGLGTVVIRFVVDNEDPIIPDGAKVTEVQAAIDAQRPITAEATVEAPTALPVNYEISITPDTAAIRTAVQAEIADLHLRDGRPGDGAGAGTIFLSRIQGAISVAAGVEDFQIVAPVADVVPALGQLPTVGTFTWS